jgi:hypothetical protein
VELPQPLIGLEEEVEEAIVLGAGGVIEEEVEGPLHLHGRPSRESVRGEDGGEGGDCRQQGDWRGLVEKQAHGSQPGGEAGSGAGMRLEHPGMARAESPTSNPKLRPLHASTVRPDALATASGGCSRRCNRLNNSSSSQAALVAACWKMAFMSPCKQVGVSEGLERG